MSAISRFALSKATRSHFVPDAGEPRLEIRDLGLDVATGGRWRARMTRSRAEFREAASPDPERTRIYYLLNGEATFTLDSHEALTVVPGDCVFVPARTRCQSVRRGRDCVALELECPPGFAAAGVGADAGSVPRTNVLFAAKTPYTDHPRHPYLIRRDLGVEAASEGLIGAHLSRAVAPVPAPGRAHRHRIDFQLLLVAQGMMRVDHGEHGTHWLLPGDCVHLPATLLHRVLERTDDCEVLEISSPARFETFVAAKRMDEAGPRAGPGH